MRILVVALLVFLFLPLANAITADDSAQSSYRVVQKYSIPGEGGWDYISVDSAARRLYVSHGTELEVLDADTGKLVGQILDTPGIHGAAIAPELKKGFTSNGRDKSVTIFDTETLKAIKKVRVAGTDFILSGDLQKPPLRRINQAASRSRLLSDCTRIQEKLVECVTALPLHRVLIR